MSSWHVPTLLPILLYIWTDGRMERETAGEDRHTDREMDIHTYLGTYIYAQKVAVAS